MYINYLPEARRICKYARYADDTKCSMQCCMLVLMKSCEPSHQCIIGLMYLNVNEINGLSLTI